MKLWNNHRVALCERMDIQKRSCFVVFHDGVGRDLFAGNFTE
jgi:hypothetical protein